MKSKYALFYAIHSRMNEFSLNVECFNRSQFLTENFDVIVNCNSKEHHTEGTVSLLLNQETGRCFIERKTKRNNVKNY